jgi:phosphoenolpyruvate carboxykinase (GTP)
MYTIDPDAWAAEADSTEEYFSQFGDRLPQAIKDQLTALRARIAAAKAGEPIPAEG